MIKNIIFITFSFIAAFVFSNESKFLLITGPSGVGKSTIIKHLKTLDNRFTYITPYTTRPLRIGETDKVSISLEKMMDLNTSGKILTINNIYGIYYATPKFLIDEAFENRLFPILDWPIDKMEFMQDCYKNRLYVVYLEPENLMQLQDQLSNDNRDINGDRFLSGQNEIYLYSQGGYDSFIDLKIVNTQNNPKKTALVIYNHFLDSLAKD